jgi:hypothetical protein
MLRKIAAPLIALTCLMPAAAQAKWLKAESRHFIVYSEGDEASIRRQAERLEKLNTLQQAATGMTEEKPGMKVTLFVVRSYYDVQQSMPFAPGGGVAGYYDASARGPYSVVSQESDSGHGFSSQLVLFHELTHHFMFQYFNVAYPVWYVEGFAEFVGASKIDDSNEAILGQQSVGRYYSFKNGWVHIRDILKARSYDDISDDLGALYAEGWLLSHYLQLGGKRDGQLAKYLTDINAGKSYEDAANDAFGDLNKLNSELISYSRRSRIPATGIVFKPLSLGDITVSTVPDDQQPMVMDDLRLYAGIAKSDIKAFAARVRADAAKGGESPLTLRLRAEADRLAGDNEDYVAAVARWNMIAPNDPQAMMHQALVQMDSLRAATSTDAKAWTAARRNLAAAAKKAPNDIIILKAYFDSFGMQGIKPTADAHNALYAVLDVVPSATEVRYQLAADFEARGDVKDAIATIRIAAFTEKDNLTPKEKAKRAKDEEKYRLAGTVKHETPRDMFNRLTKLQADSAKAN